jgi:hypothetical protein
MVSELDHVTPPESCLLKIDYMVSELDHVTPPESCRLKIDVHRKEGISCSTLFSFALTGR